MTIEAFWEQLKGGVSYALFCHVRPDGDSVGGATALKRALESTGKTADIFCDDQVPEKFFYLYGAADIKREITEKYDCYVAVDCSEIRRLGKFSSLFTAGNKTFNIDHHVSNTRYAKSNCVIDVAANCENIFALIKVMGAALDKETATCLLTGISTDTGNFAHKNTEENSFLCAAELVAAGADINDINYRMFRNQSKERAKLYGLTMSKIRFFADDKIGLISVLKSDLEKSGANPDATEGFIDFVMNIECVKVAVCILETADKTFKVSFRSKGADVNAVASTFGGGGHVLASGCMISGYYEDVVDRLVYACKQHMADV